MRDHRSRILLRSIRATRYAVSITGSRPIIHIDAYRIAADDEFLQLGPDEYYEPPNLVLIEWASRVARCLPRERLEIDIAVGDDQARTFKVTGHGKRYAEVVKKLESMVTRA